MRRNVSLWQFAGFSLSALAGTLLHFLYDWTNGWVVVAPVSGVNESTWEHMKLLYFPLLLFALVQRRFFADDNGFWCVKLRGILVGLLSIPVIFYTYNGAFGKSPDWVNITIFFVAAGLAFLLEWRLFTRADTRCACPWIAVAVIGLIGGLFVVWTFLPPAIPLFRDPLTGAYGIPV